MRAEGCIELVWDRALCNWPRTAQADEISLGQIPYAQCAGCMTAKLNLKLTAPACMCSLCNTKPRNMPAHAGCPGFFLALSTRRTISCAAERWTASGVCPSWQETFNTMAMSDATSDIRWRALQRRPELMTGTIGPRRGHIAAS